MKKQTEQKQEQESREQEESYFCITFLYFLYSFFCNLQCTLFATNPADWLPYQ